MQSKKEDDIRLNPYSVHSNFEREMKMRNESKLMKEILEEIKETNRLIQEMSESLSLLKKRMLPERHSSETIQKGDAITEITVRNPEKLEEWRKLFESKGLRVEYYEPYQTNGEEYFAKLWGYLDRKNPSREQKVKNSEMRREAFLTQERHF
jgi:hypothetical protein